MTRSPIMPLSLLALALAACSPPEPSDKTRGQSEALGHDKAIDGIGSLKLGMSFNEAIGDIDATQFYGGSIAECIPQLPVAGCRLYGRNESVYMMREAIPYFLSLAFNRLGKLTDISLHYRREGGIDGAQCRDIFGRTIDWVTADFGPLMARQEDKATEEPKIWSKTPGGASYAYGVPNKDGNFVTHFMQSSTIKQAVKTVAGEKESVVLNRHIYVLASYIIASKPNCEVTVSLAEPDRVERAAWQTETPAAVNSEGENDE